MNRATPEQQARMLLWYMLCGYIFTLTTDGAYWSVLNLLVDLDQVSSYNWDLYSYIYLIQLMLRVVRDDVDPKKMQTGPPRHVLSLVRVLLVYIGLCFISLCVSLVLYL